MKNINLFILVILIVLVIYFIYKNQENFKLKNKPLEINVVKESTPLILGVYYTDWCGHSHNFLQQLEGSLKTKLEKENVSIRLVDCDKNKETCQKFQIEGFPTLLLHTDNKDIHYNGNRTDDDILNFVRENKESKSENIIKSSNKMLGIYYTEWCGHSREFLKQLENGLKTKLEKEGVSIRLIDCEKNNDLCQKMHIEGYPTILLHTDNKDIHYNGNRTDDDILNFVKNN